MDLDDFNLDVSASDESLNQTNVSRLITEEDLIDSLFFTCDLEGAGEVPVSRLIEYLRFTTSSLSESKHDIDDLCFLLDPCGLNPSVDLDTYRATISHWIRDIRNRSTSSEEMSDSKGDIPLISLSPVGSHFRPALASSSPKPPPRHKRSSSSQCPIVRNGEAVSTLCGYSNNMEGMGSGGETSSVEVDPLELTNCIADLKFQNRKLVEGSNKLRQQLENSEDALARITQDNEELHRQIKSHQQMCERTRELQEENEDLKGTLAIMEEGRKALEYQIAQLEREKSNLESQLGQVQDKLLQTTCDLELSQKHVVDLQNTLLDQRHQRVKAEEMQAVQEVQLKEKDAAVDELKHQLAELATLNQNLKMERADLEKTLAQTKQELVMSHHRKLSRKEIGGGDESEEELMPVKLPKSNMGSPCPPSIGSEIKRSIMHDCSPLPSPLCDKELEEMMQSVNKSVSPIPLMLDADGEVAAILDSSPQKNNFSAYASQIVSQFHWKKERVLEQINELTEAHLHDHKTQSSRKSPDVLKKQLKEEMESFADKVTCLAASKQAAEYRMSRLSSALKIMKDQNNAIQTKYREVLQQLGAETGTLDTTVGGKLTELKQHLDAEQQQKFQLQDELGATKSQLAKVTQEVEILTSNLDHVVEAKQALEKEVDQLKSAHADIAQKLRHSDAQMSGMKDDLQRKEVELHQEKDKATDLEDSLLESRLKHQLDLKEIWRLVHKEIETECLSDSQDLLEQDTPISVSTDSVRDQVAKEIQNLRSQLARSEATLAALTKKGLPLCFSKTTADRNYDWKNNNDRHSPSSPLVEALTLGTFDGNQNSIRRGQGSSSADDILDAQENNNELGSENAQSLARSCPSLAHKLVTSGTQTEDAFHKSRPPQIGSSKFTVTNTSTGSSTSGAVDLDVSSGSLHSDSLHVHSTKQKRKDICKTVQIVETACTPESPSSPNSVDSAWRGRTSSFKRAIERGQSQDSSNQSFETCDPPSTSPDVSPERLELPPYPGPSRSTPMLKDSWVVLSDPYAQIPESTEICVANARTHLTPPSLGPAYASFGSFQSHSLSDSLPSWDYFTPSHKDIYYTSPPNHTEDMEEKREDLGLQPAATTADVPAVEDRQSPNLNRRLSTLVEEGSDAEAEESLTQASPAAGGATSSRIEELPDYKPPQYKAPPAYEQALARKEGQSPKLDPRSKSRQHSPHAGRGASQSPQRTQSRESSPRPGTGTPQRDRSQSPLPPPHKSRMTAAGVSSRELAMAMAAEKIQRPSSPVSHSARPEAEAMAGHHMSRSKRRVGIMHEVQMSPQMKKEGQLIDLAYGDLEEVELSEADKLLNAQLLEEAKKAAKNKTRRGRRGSGSSPDLARTLSFDEGTAEEEVDILENTPSTSRTSKAPEQLHSPPKSPRGSCGTNTPPRSPRSKEDSDTELDVKKEILQGLNHQKADKPQGEFTHRPFRITTNTQLAKLREENLAKKRGHMKQVKMPELSETSETESGKGTCSGGSMDSESETSSDKTQNEHLQPPPASQNTVVFPSLPESYLKKLGVHRKKGEQPEKRADQLSEQEVEEKFASLALAFKTDKLTLDKRIELQERARDIAEQNIDREIQGLKEAMKVLSQYCAVAESRDVYTKIQHHIEVLEQSTVRVSSRAELHGAVQQEFRMSNAIEVMVQHVENLKRIYEKEHGELEETRKILQDNNMIAPEPDVGMLQKRSYSIATAAGAFKVGRRRASVAVVSGRGGQSSDPKSRFQSLFGDTSSAASGFLHSLGRRTSLSLGLGSDRPNVWPASETPSANHADKSSTREKEEDEDSQSPPSQTTGVTADTTTTKTKKQSDKKNNEEEEKKTDTNANITEQQVFQKGFEEGIRAQVSQELGELREQQTAFCDSLERLMDQNDMEDEEEEYETPVEKLWRLCPQWDRAGQKVRFTIAGFVFLMALCSIVFTLVPLGRASERHHYFKSWDSVKERTWPYTALDIAPPT